MLFSVASITQPWEMMCYTSLFFKKKLIIFSGSIIDNSCHSNVVSITKEAVFFLFFAISHTGIVGILFLCQKGNDQQRVASGDKLSPFQLT